jgi:hypothetical protein
MESGVVQACAQAPRAKRPSVPENPGSYRGTGWWRSMSWDKGIIKASWAVELYFCRMAWSTPLPS